MYQVPGKYSAICKQLLRNMLLGESGLPQGLMLPIGPDGAPVRIKILFGRLLADKDALSDFWAEKGASGVIPCGIKCMTVNKPVASDVENSIASLSARDQSIADISNHDFSKMVLNSSEDVWRKCDHMGALANAGRGRELEFHEKYMYGLNWCPQGILADKELRQFIKPPECQRDDPLHILWSNGIVGVELALFLKACKNVGRFDPWESLREHIAQRSWRTRQMTTSQILAMFNKHKESNMGDHFKGGAGQILGVYPIVRFWIETTMGERRSMTNHIASILCLFELCDLMEQAIAPMSPADLRKTVAAIKKAASVHLRLYVLVYGRQAVKFKHHQFMHVPDQILADGCVLSCWVTERKNKAALHAAQNQTAYHDSLTFEKACLKAVFLEQISVFKAAKWVDCLKSPTSFPELASLTGSGKACISSEMRTRIGDVKKGDLLFVSPDQQRVMVVVACYSLDDDLGIIFRDCECMHHLTAKCFVFDVKPQLSYKLLQEIGWMQRVKAWTYESNHRVAVLA